MIWPANYFTPKHLATCNVPGKGPHSHHAGGSWGTGSWRRDKWRDCKSCHGGEAPAPAHCCVCKKSDIKNDQRDKKCVLELMSNSEACVEISLGSLYIQLWHYLYQWPVFANHVNNPGIQSEGIWPLSYSKFCRRRKRLRTSSCVYIHVGRSTLALLASQTASVLTSLLILLAIFWSNQKCCCTILVPQDRQSAAF